MCLTDERLLEVLIEIGPATVSSILAHESVRAPRSVVRDRLYALAHAELVAPVGRVGERRNWELTTEGVRYLQGDLDAEHQPHPRRSQWPTTARS
jgi:hypothetical protein